MADRPFVAASRSTAGGGGREGNIFAFGQWRCDRAGRRHLRHWLRRVIRAGCGAGSAQTFQIERQRNRSGSDANRERNLYFHERELHDGRIVSGTLKEGEEW